MYLRKRDLLADEELMDIAIICKPRARYKIALYTFNEKGLVYSQYHHLIYEEKYNATTNSGLKRRWDEGKTSVLHEHRLS